jgi:hypothetical protein
LDKRIEGTEKESSFALRLEMNNPQCQIRSLIEKLMLLSKRIPNQSLNGSTEGALICKKNSGAS